MAPSMVNEIKEKFKAVIHRVFAMYQLDAGSGYQVWLQVWLMKLKRSHGYSFSLRTRAQLGCFTFVILFAFFGLILMANLLSDNSFRKMHLAKSSTATAAPVIEVGPKTPKDAVWQPVLGLSFFVYSAFMEPVTANAVRIIAVAKTKRPGAVFCKLWLHNGTYTLPAKVQAIRENWGLKYSATFVLCILEDGLRSEDVIGASIAVLAEDVIEPHTNLLQVLDTRPVPATEQSVHVCVKPIHYNYSRDLWLLEWLEMNILIGVSHFYMYTKSLSPSVECIIKYFHERGLITILPWKVQFKSQVKIRTENMFAALNDCLYRSMSRAAWLLVIDLDELVLPQRAHTLQQLLKKLSKNPVLAKSKLKHPAAFLFRNAFFYLKWKDDPSSTSWLVTARKTRRRADPNKARNRSKYVVRPPSAVEIGNHFLWQMQSTYSSAVAPTNEALLHHYRAQCEFGGNACLNTTSVVDHTALKFTKLLEHRMNKMLHVLPKICPINDTYGRNL